MNPEEREMTKEELVAQIVEELSMIADDFKTYGDRECAIGIEEAAEYIEINYLRGQGE